MTSTESCSLSSALLSADFGASPKTAPHQLVAGGHLGTQGTSWGPSAGWGVQLEGQGTQEMNGVLGGAWQMWAIW
eukprot:scaffold69843_cov16-Tisochrysis_lutea.AAC.1